MCMISQEALDARIRASANSVPFPGPEFLSQLAPTPALAIVPDDDERIPAAPVSLPMLPAKYAPSNRQFHVCAQASFNKDYTGKGCPHYENGLCSLLQDKLTPYKMLSFPVEFEHSRNFNLIERIKVDLPLEVAEFGNWRFHWLFKPTVRAKLLGLYDKYLAAFMLYSDANGRYMPAPVPGDDAYIREYEQHLKLVEDLKRILEQHKHTYYGGILYEFTKIKKDLADKKVKVPAFDPYDRIGSTELIEAYERAQYLERLSLGEPVVFQDGRCLFEFYVIRAGYRPGPFPGLEYYTYKNEYVDPSMFAQWLRDKLPERKQSTLYPVGYSGQPSCFIYFADILKFYYQNFKVLGPATFQVMKDMMPKTWRHCL